MVEAEWVRNKIPFDKDPMACCYVLDVEPYRIRVYPSGNSGEGWQWCLWVGDEILGEGDRPTTMEDAQRDSLRFFKKHLQESLVALPEPPPRVHWVSHGLCDHIRLHDAGDFMLEVKCISVEPPEWKWRIWKKGVTNAVNYLGTPLATNGDPYSDPEVAQAACWRSFQGTYGKA